MSNSPITGNADLDAYLFDLQSQIGESGAASGTLAADSVTGEITIVGTDTVVGYLKKYLHVKYADDFTGNGFTSNPLNKIYFGVYNSDSSFESTNPADYVWRETIGFGTTKLLYYRVQSGRLADFIVSDTNIDGYDYENGDAIDLDLVAGLIEQIPVRTYVKKFLKLRYADSITPTTIYTSAWGHTFWGVAETDTHEEEPAISDYRWYRAKTEEGTFVTFDQYGYDLYFWSRGGRNITFQVQSVSPDNSIWGKASVNIKEINNPYIDLDIRSGLVLTRGSTPDGLSSVPTTTDPITGIVSYQMLQTLPNPLNFNITEVSNISTDQYGRIITLGFLDQFYAASESFTATSNNQVLSFTHIVGQAIYFRNGILVDPTEFSETSTTVTISGLKAGDVVGAFRFRMLDGSDSSAIIPFVVETYTLTAGQSVIPSALENNSELLFANGIFQDDYSYTLLSSGNIQLEYPVAASTKFNIIKFEVRNGYSPVFSQSITNVDSSMISMSNTLDGRGLISTLNGVNLIENTDYTFAEPSTINFSFTPVGLFETTSFVSNGSGEWNGVPKSVDIDYTLSDQIPGPAKPPKLGDIINELRLEILNLSTEVNNLKGNTK